MSQAIPSEFIQESGGKRWVEIEGIPTNDLDWSHLFRRYLERLAKAVREANSVSELVASQQIGDALGRAEQLLDIWGHTNLTRNLRQQALERFGDLLIKHEPKVTAFIEKLEAGEEVIS